MSKNSCISLDILITKLKVWVILYSLGLIEWLGLATPNVVVKRGCIFSFGACHKVTQGNLQHCPNGNYQEKCPSLFHVRENCC